jgi:hypothetical protein
MLTGLVYRRFLSVQRSFWRPPVPHTCSQRNGQSSNTFHMIPAALNAEHFMKDKTPPTDPDDDYGNWWPDRWVRIKR